MAKLPWYIGKWEGDTITFNRFWICWQKVKMALKIIILGIKNKVTKIKAL